MTSPFPGMDPFIEGQCWSDFHSDFIVRLREQLVSTLLPDYFVNVEKSIMLVRDGEDAGHVDRMFASDLSIEESGEWAGGSNGGAAMTERL